MVNENELTQEYLKSILYYNLETGDFTWLVKIGSNDLIGNLAGSITNYGYRSIGIKDKRYQAHRLAWLYMKGYWPKNQIDHINGIKDDNRWINLREVDNSQNQHNRNVNINNSLKVKGVSLHGKRYRAYVSVNGKRYHVGTYSTVEEAKIARDDFAKLSKGEYFKS